MERSEIGRDIIFVEVRMADQRDLNEPSKVADNYWIDITASHLASALSQGRMEEGFRALVPEWVPRLVLGY